MKHVCVLLAACLLMASPAHHVAAETKAGPGATVIYNGKTYELRLYGMCGASPERGYNIWAVTPDENEPDVAKDGAPRLHAMSNGIWSALEFYESGSEPTAKIRGEGASRVDMEGGEMSYEGPVGDGSGETIEIHLRC